MPYSANPTRYTHSVFLLTRLSSSSNSAQNQRIFLLFLDLKNIPHQWRFHHRISFSEAKDAIVCMYVYLRQWKTIGVNRENHSEGSGWVAILFCTHTHFET